MFVVWSPSCCWTDFLSVGWAATVFLNAGKLVLTVITTGVVKKGLPQRCQEVGKNLWKIFGRDFDRRN